MIRPHPISSLFPYTTLFRSGTEIFQFSGFASNTYEFSIGYLLRGGFPHSDIAGSKSAADSPTLIAGCHVLHRLDRKSTRLNSSHMSISYAVFCLKKKTKHTT